MFSTQVLELLNFKISDLYISVYNTIKKQLTIFSAPIHLHGLGNIFFLSAYIFIDEGRRV